MRWERYRDGYRSGRGLQVRGDPSIRDFLFQQTRVESEFDRHMDEMLAVALRLLTERRVFHVIIHFSSNQLTCWPSGDPYRYQVHVGRSVLAPGFVERFPICEIGELAIPQPQLPLIVAEFRRLRFKDPNIYLRNGSVNVVNGIIGMSFSCDGSHYLPYDDFFQIVGSY